MMPALEPMRLIDKEHGKRTKPVKILCLGLSRTGTMSLRAALRHLGYRVYHFSDAIEAGPARTLPLWEEAMTAKANGNMKPYGRAEFDKMFGDFDGAIDVPAVLLTDEILAAFPDAKIILTNRDPDKWIASWQNTILHVMSWRSWTWLASWDRTLAGPWYTCASMVLNQQVGDWSLTVDDWTSPRYLQLLKEAYRRHYAHVRNVVPEDRLLEFRSENGWESLCEFLGEDVPRKKYPFVNEKKDFVSFHQYMWYRALGKMVVKTVVLPAITAAGMWYIWRSGCGRCQS